MTRDDLELAMRLKRQAGWNQTLADWRRFLELEPEGCFVGEWQSHAVATTTTCVFETIGWIAMVLVEDAFRHRGIASRLVQHALRYLEEREVATVRLDATRLGMPVYQKLGFVGEHELIRFQGTASNDPPQPGDELSELVPLTQLVQLDRRATGTDRKRLLERLVMEFPDGVRSTVEGENISGYVLLRPGSDADQIGPAVASCEQDGATLCEWALRQTSSRRVLIDIPVNNHAAVAWARSKGLTEQRRFCRMCRGPAANERVDLLWASSGPEKG